MMKSIEIDDQLYQYLLENTQVVGESASSILRRLLRLPLEESLNSIDKKSPSLSSVSFTRGSQFVTEKPVSSVLQTTTKKNLKHNVTMLPPIQQELVLPIARNVSEQDTERSIGRVMNLLDSVAFKTETKVVVRFLQVLSELYRSNPETFSLATESVQGRTRLYFALDEGILLSSSASTKPKLIPGSPFWVATNNNSERKFSIIEGVMLGMRLPQFLIDHVREFIN